MSTQTYDTHTSANTIVQDVEASIAGKVILTTGVSPGGLGAFFVEQIAAASPKLLILAGRNTSKVQAVASALAKSNPHVETRLLELDLSSLKQVREAGAVVNGWEDVAWIDVLVNNAGIMACEYTKTVDGFESQFAVNHLGPFLFTNLVMGKLLQAKEPRVVNVSSDGHRMSAIRWPDVGFSEGEVYNKWRAYGQGKTANVLFATGLARKLSGKGLSAFALHPGVINTNIGNHLNWGVDFQGMQNEDKVIGNKEGYMSEFDFKSPERGVATHVYAAFEPSLKDHNGAYLQDSHIADPLVDTIKPHAHDPVEADRLWKLSEELIGESFAY